jgi:hypothetical protein
MQAVFFPFSTSPDHEWPARCELRGAYLLDMKPTFPMPQQWVRFTTPPSSLDLSPEVSEYTERAFQMWSSACLDVPEWLSAYTDLVAFALCSFKRNPSMRQLADMPSEFGAWSNPMIHRLLSWHPTEGTVSQNTIVQETCRLGALLYLVPVWRCLGVSPRIFAGP